MTQPLSSLVSNMRAAPVLPGERVGCGRWAMVRRCARARADENAVGGAEAGTGSGNPIGSAPYSVAPATTRSVRKAIAAFVPGPGLSTARASGPLAGLLSVLISHLCDALQRLLLQHELPDPKRLLRCEDRKRRATMEGGVCGRGVAGGEEVAVLTDAASHILGSESGGPARHDGAVGLVAHHFLESDGEPDGLTAYRIGRCDRRGVAEHQGEHDGVERTPRVEPLTIHLVAVRGGHQRQSRPRDVALLVEFRTPRA